LANGKEMTGYLIFAFVLICALVWFAMRTKSSRSDLSTPQQSKRDGIVERRDAVNPGGKWVDTIRRDGAGHMDRDADTVITEVMDRSTVKEDMSSHLWHQSLPAPAPIETAPRPEPIKLPKLPALSTDPAVIDREISALHKEATRLKGKDWPAAISALEKATILDAAHNRWNDMTRMVRLPTFLQQAGRFDEAMAEFERLIDRVPIYVQEHSGTDNELARSATLHREYEVLYDKMRLACKREKHTEQAEKYAQKSAVHKQALSDLKEIRKSKRKK
jgi:hypothetical protein